MGGPCGEGELGQAGGGEDEYGFGSFSDVSGERGSASKRRGGFVDSREDFDFKGVGRTIDFEGLREGSWGWVDRKVVGKACKGFLIPSADETFDRPGSTFESRSQDVP